MQTHYRLVSHRPAAAKPVEKHTYPVKAKVRIYAGAATWYFATLPTATSKAIKNRFGHAARGWGSLPVSVRLGGTEWATSIFPDKQAGTYILPLKAAVRKREGVSKGDTLELQLTVGV